MAQKIRVGIVGLKPDISWAARAHVPALKFLKDDFEIAGVANTSLASAEEAATAYGIPHAYASVEELASSPEIDLVSVTVRVPYHLELVKAATDAGKHVYCEWPLGNGLAEAEKMAAMVCATGVIGVVGTQARVAPEVLYLRKLIEDGYIGEVLSTTITAQGRSWGATHTDFQNRAYLLDNRNGASMLTIPFGHTIGAVRDVLGDFSTLSAMIENRRKEILLPETDKIVPFDTPDQIAVCGRIGPKAVPIVMHYRGGMPRGDTGLVWEINGTRGDLRVTGLHGGSQQVQLTIEGGQGLKANFEKIELPADFDGDDWPDHIYPANVARLYARMGADIRNGTRLAPSFDDAVELHRVIDTMEHASAECTWKDVDAPNRPLPYT
ncbi:MAG: Gfo/Idh/MocA family protein [Pseudorhodobacter sp.]